MLKVDFIKSIIYFITIKITMCFIKCSSYYLSFYDGQNSIQMNK